mgnify:CR=1 FL=1
MEVYYYIPAAEVSNAVECGLKLSRWSDREAFIDGDLKKCICGLLNPKDDAVKYNSRDLRCIKLEVPSNYCYVADRYLYLVGLSNPKVMDLYTESVVPVEKYRFGSYRLPECLVTSTIIGGNVGVLDKRLDSPVLFGNSEELYIGNIIEAYKEMHDDFNDTMLYNFYCKLAEFEKVDKIEDNEKKIAVFIDKRNQVKPVTIKIPDMEGYL